jgi:hypothetical protein
MIFPRPPDDGGRRRSSAMSGTVLGLAIGLACALAGSGAALAADATGAVTPPPAATAGADMLAVDLALSPGVSADDAAGLVAFLDLVLPGAADAGGALRIPLGPVTFFATGTTAAVGFPLDRLALSPPAREALLAGRARIEVTLRGDSAARAEVAVTRAAVESLPP